MTTAEALAALLPYATPDELNELDLLVALAEEDRRRAESEAPERGRWEPLPHQIPPEGDWRYWMLLAGRGSGKTDACAAYFDDYLSTHPGERGRIIAPTIGDAREACVEGPSGILAHNRSVQFNRSWGELTWPNGARARIFGAFTPNDVERLRAGGNANLDWYEELAAWRQMEDAWRQADLGLRLGWRPHGVISTTPKPRPLIRRLVEQFANGDPLVAITKAATYDNPHLDASVRERFRQQYEGTRLGRQELDAEILEDVEGALWSWEMLEKPGARILPGEAPGMRRVVVAVDPSWGTTHDECGIVVAGVGFDGRGYVLDDRSARTTPSAWGAIVKDAYHHWEADRILAEVNFQAEQVRLVMQTTDPHLPYQELRVSRSKVLRAEPVVALYEQGRVSHVGRFAGLEQQMTEWVPGESDISPDRVDALVFALSALMLDAGGPGGSAADYLANAASWRRR